MKMNTKNKKRVSEAQYSVDSDDLSKVAPVLKQSLKPEDRVKITPDDGTGINSKSTYSSSTTGMGGIHEEDGENNPWAICTASVGREDKAKYESCVKKVKAQKGITEDEDTPEDLRGLYGDEEREERGEEYGIKTEDFDRLMDKLRKKSNTPKITINERVNPRIKKADLIKYIKTKQIVENEFKQEFDFNKSSIESASGDKVVKREEDEFGNPLYWSLKNKFVNYFIGDSGKIVMYNAKTGKYNVIGNLENYE